METHYPYSRYLQETFGGKTYKIVVSSGLTCPTRDGTIAKRGCAFCDVRGSSSFHAKKGRGSEVKTQIRTRIPPIRERFGAEKFLAYFQSYTNTYSDVDYLREIYTAALEEQGIDGLCIGTRPDCLPDDCLKLLEELAQEHYVSLELGVQSFENKTLEWLKRGHSAECSMEALERAARLAPRVQTCAHLIFGNPTDPSDAPARAARLLNTTKVRGAKLHQLMVLENTELAEWYRETPFKTSTLGEYCEMVRSFIENLSPEIYLERLCATATHPEECLAPEWSRGRWEPHNRIREYLAQNQCLQGRLLT